MTAPLRPLAFEGDQRERSDAEPRQQGEGEESKDKDAKHQKDIGGSPTGVRPVSFRPKTTPWLTESVGAAIPASAKTPSHRSQSPQAMTSAANKTTTAAIRVMTPNTTATAAGKRSAR
jgi:hypothetical protein